MDWPLVGRGAELDRARATILGRPRRGILLVGAAGVGKTKLARALVDDLAARGHAVEWIRTSPGAGAVPFAPFAHLLPAELPETPWGVFRRILAALEERRSAAGPPILGIDDVPHLDEISAALVHHAATRGIAVPVLTARDLDPLPEPIDRLWSEGALERLVLAELDRHAVDELLEAVLGSRATPPRKRRVWELSQGNPLLVRELVLAGIDTVDDPVALAAADRLVEVVADRIGALDAEAQAALEILAVGGTLEQNTMTAHVDPELLAHLEAERLLTVETEGRRWIVRFTHPLHGEVLRARMPRSRHRRISALLAEHLVATGMRRRGDVLRAATHQLDGGLRTDRELLVRAAEEALGSFAYDLAIRFARAASIAGSDPRALLVLGEALSRCQCGDEAEVAFAAALESIDDPVLRAQAVVARARNLGFVLGEVVAARRLVAEELTMVDASSPPATLLRLTDAWIAGMQGSFGAAVRLADEVLAAEIDDRVRLEALVVATLGMVMTGRVEAAEELIADALDLASTEGEGVPFAIDLLETNRFMGMTFAGRIHEAEELARRGYERAAAEGIPEMLALWAADLAFVEERRGRLASALGRAEEAMELGRRHDPFSIRGLVTGFAAVIAAEMGDTGTFRRHAADLEAITAPADFRTRTVAHRVTVWDRVLAGDLEGAAHAAAELGALGIEGDAVNWAVLTAYDAVRLGFPELVAELLASTARSVDGELVPVMHRHAEAAIAADPDGVEAVAGAFEDLGCDLFALEAFAEAARLHTRAGNRAGAARARGRFAALRERLADVATPALVDPPPLLTPRELQIARLAVHHTSREIAERLSISVRTVDNHLASVYAKLGVHGRDELAEVLPG
ncbi:MAG TPA: hypothetical protein ENK55_01230 [Actinobacteria bacterium]|nr:hypothetical protein [Actinomycetota bacterium]